MARKAQPVSEVTRELTFTFSENRIGMEVTSIVQGRFRSEYCSHSWEVRNGQVHVEVETVNRGTEYFTLAPDLIRV